MACVCLESTWSLLCLLSVQQNQKPSFIYVWHMKSRNNCTIKKWIGEEDLKQFPLLSVKFSGSDLKYRYTWTKCLQCLSISAGCFWNIAPLDSLVSRAKKSEKRDEPVPFWATLEPGNPDSNFCFETPWQKATPLIKSLSLIFSVIRQPPSRQGEIHRTLPLQ